ncbi:MAG: tetratricopeptide repeat protein [Magnetovibrio sp.]|nr:tetratricopeptide repeat protein [Magnetovibrio sp.]
MAIDKLGLEFTASLPETVDAFNGAMDDYMVFAGEPVGHMLAAAEVDPDFAMGYCLTGCLRLFGGVSAAHPRVNLELRAARARRARVTAREQTHIDAFEMAAGGEIGQAGAMWDAILAEHPLDMMAAKCAHECYYLVGESGRMKTSVMNILPAWNESVPYYGFLLGMGAFGLEEAGDYRDAEEMGRRAYAIEPRDCWAVHAVAHVMQMEGRCQDGIRWLDETVDDWQGAVWLQGHLWWHQCLPLIDDGQFGRVLEIFDRHISHCDKDMVTRLMDCTSVLWRLELKGVDFGTRWDSLVDLWMHHVDEHALAFTDAHLAMTLAAAGGEKKLRRFLESQHAYIEGSDSSVAAIVERIGRDLCQGMIEFQRGDYVQAANRIYPIRDEIWRIGGSNAQRDVFLLTLMAALIRAGRHEEARAVLASAAADVPTPSLLLYYGDALDGLGEAQRAEAVRAQARQLVQ